MAMDVIDYNILGADTQLVEVTLDPQEAVVGEPGAMMFMEDGVKMETIFGDGSGQDKGLFGNLLGAGKRLLTGESMFTTVFSNQSPQRRKVAFAAPYPGKVMPVNLAEVGGVLECQRDAFLCGARGVSLGIAFTKRLGAGFFGGEGFILQRLEGDGWVFLHSGGTLIQKDLAPGEILRFDPGCLVAKAPTVDFDIQFAGGLKSAIFGGEGIFLGTLRGPGRVWLQSLPLSRLARRVMAAAPPTGAPATPAEGLTDALGGLFNSGD